MKKILIITLEYPPQIGGIATYVKQFASSLNPEQVVVLAPKDVEGLDYDSQQTIKIYRRRLFFPKIIWPRWLKLFFCVLRIVKKEKIEIIYIHHILPVGYVVWLLKKFKKIPYLVFSHGTDVEAGARSSWKRRMVSMVAKDCEQLIFNSENLKRKFLRVQPDLAEKCLVLYPCPEQKFYEQPEAEVIAGLKAHYALEGKRVMLSIARLADGKGLTHLVRILPLILEKIPNLVWLIIGDGPKRFFSD